MVSASGPNLKEGFLRCVFVSIKPEFLWNIQQSCADEARGVDKTWAMS